MPNYIQWLRSKRSETDGSKAEAKNVVHRITETTREQARKTAKDSWLLRLEGLRGKKWDDGIERISTQTVFDILEVPHRSRTAGACRRLSKLMRELGWSPIKARGLTPGGFRDQVRGYARDTTRQTVM
jgi:hypothetical protein